MDAALPDRRRLIQALWIALGVVLLAVTVVPQIDLGVTTLFYEGARGFPERGTLIGDFVRHQVPRLVLGSVALCAVLWCVGLLRGEAILDMTTPRLIYLLATLSLGPGLVVETLLKPHWHRARPDQILPFGGAATYSPPLLMGHGCADNCSFASGHAAVAFWVTAYAFLLPPAYRVGGMTLALLFGAGVGAVRVMQGAHFLSDVLYAGAIVVGTNALAFLVLRRYRAVQP